MCRDGKQQQQRFLYPTNILCTREGFVFIMEKHRLLVLDPQELRMHQPPIRGNFSGLVQEEGGAVCTLEQVPLLAVLLLESFLCGTPALSPLLAPPACAPAGGVGPDGAAAGPGHLGQGPQAVRPPPLLVGRA